MFKTIAPDPSSDNTVTIVFEGTTIQVRKGISVAAALLEAGVTYFRTTPVGTTKRAPVCMMGVCFECLLCINNQPNVQACMMEVAEGMQIVRQLGTNHPAIQHSTQP